MATHSKFIASESEFKVENGSLIEGASLGTKVVAKMNASTGDLEALNIGETYNALDAIGWHINEDGQRWWSNPNNQVFGTENTGGSGNWGVYKQSNIYTTARKYAGKDSLYGMHIFRYPNIPSGSTWGGLSLYPPAACKLRGHKYRLSFDYRGSTNGHYMDVYQNYTIGWGNLGIGLPTPWNQGIGAFDTDWEWKRYEYDFTIEDQYLDWVPGSNGTPWDPNVQYGNWSLVTHEGYVYRKPSWTGTPTKGVPPSEEYPSIWDYRAAMVAGSFDLYNNLKIGFSYQAQGTRGTHVFVDNIQITDITNNTRWKFNGSGWEADNLAEKTTHIFAKGTGFVTQDKGDGADIFAVEGNRVLEINGNRIYDTSGRGLRLTVINEDGGDITLDQLYDTYGDDAARTNLANALSNISIDQLWVLTSFDAINSNAALDAQMSSMGSVLLVNDGNPYSVYTGGGVRHPYAAVGRGQKLIKEDGSNASDSVYKRKGVIDLKL